MSDEDKELLARIGQLAGLSSVLPASPPASLTNCYQAKSIATKANRPAPTLHRRIVQLPIIEIINANVFEKQSQSRTAAIEETRKKKEAERRRGEKTRLNEFLRHQQSAASALANANASTARNEIVIDGIRFQVLDGGKKLARVTGESNSLAPTPKNTVIAGVKFYRTKTGNLVVNSVVKDHRRTGAVKKISEPCRIFSTTGNCLSASVYPRLWIPTQTRSGVSVALCKDFLKEGRCAHGDSCDLSHDLTPERVPNCLHYAKGHCAKAECPFTHSKASPGAPVCKAFGFRGYCEKGAECTERHVFECPDFSNTGRCNVKGCKLPHRERASVLRSQQKPDQVMEDLSSDDEDGADSDDVDSDDVAEFIEADSDASDVEDRQDFISL
ncbi:hypothetical protein ACO1O0_001074 [Amphichorda felina]